MLAVTAWLGIVTLATASLSPRKESLALGAAGPRAVRLSARAVELAAGRGVRSEYVLTDRTEVFLNGKACKYADVPSNARIIRMELAADQQRVLSIQFRTGK
jgi:hypothetical protein